MLFHWQLIDPFWPDAQPWDTWILVVVAVLVVTWDRGTMLTRERAVTEVITTGQAFTPRAAKSERAQGLHHGRSSAARLCHGAGHGAAGQHALTAFTPASNHLQY